MLFQNELFLPMCGVLSARLEEMLEESDDPNLREDLQNIQRKYQALFMMMKDVYVKINHSKAMQCDDIIDAGK